MPLHKIARMRESTAYRVMRSARWPATDGEPICPGCGTEAWTLGDHARAGDPRQFKCKECRCKFTVTSGTLFHGRKLSHRTILMAVKLFLTGAKGVASTTVSAEVGIAYKSAFVLAHKLREAMMLEGKDRTVSGTVEVDGSYYGGHVRKLNRKESRADRRKRENLNHKRICVVAARERGKGGKTVVTVVKHEAGSRAFIVDRVDHMTHLYSDEGTGWTPLHAVYKLDQVNHQIEFSNDGVCTNQAESLFSRLRRAELGTHHKIAGPYLYGYATDMAWREDNRGLSQQQKFTALLGAALGSPQSRTMKGYWQPKPKDHADDVHPMDVLLGLSGPVMKWREFREVGGLRSMQH